MYITGDFELILTYWLEYILIRTFKSLTSSLSVAMNQERIRAVGGLKALAIALQEQVASDSISTAQCDHTSAVIIVDALIHCVNASSKF